jgi:thiol:disulfide interchange protein
MGLSLIAAGVMFAVHLIIPEILTYYYIFRLWPLILILLGAEVLTVNLRNREEKIIYDGWAIFIMVLAMMLAGTLAGCQILLDYGVAQGHIIF